MSHSFEYGQVIFDFKIDGKIERATFDYKYYPHTDAIDYIDIKYTNPKLQSLIENDPKMMENIDSYIRNLLEKKYSQGTLTSLGNHSR
jgi:hypothetical protein